MNKKIIEKNTPNRNKERLLEGGLIGAVLGIATGLLIAPKSGKNLREDIKKIPGDFYKYITPQIKKLKEMGEEQYNNFIDEGVKKYVKIKKLTQDEEKILKKEAKSSWKHIKKHL